MARNIRKCLMVLPLVLLAAACSPSAKPTAAESASTRVSTAPSPTAPASSAPPDTTCQKLQVVQKPGNDAASGRIYIVINVINTSGSTCVLNGFPTFQLLSGGSVLAASLQHGGSGPAPMGSSPSPVTLAASAKAGFLVMYWNRTSGGGGGCPTASQMRLTSPGPFTGTVDILVCSGQPISVSPYVPASSLPSF